MSFFDDRPHYVPSDPAGQRQRDEWNTNGRYIAGNARRPRLQIPAIMPARPSVLANTGDTAVAITHLEIYRGGIWFPLTLRARTGFGPTGLDLGAQVLHPRAIRDHTHGPSEPLSADVLRFGVQFPDGAKATNLDEWSPAEEQMQSKPVLFSDGGRGHGHLYELGQWLRTLPPPGSLAFVCEWPALGVAESRVEQRWMFNLYSRPPPVAQLFGPTPEYFPT